MFLGFIGLITSNLNCKAYVYKHYCTSRLTVEDRRAGIISSPDASVD